MPPNFPPIYTKPNPRVHFKSLLCPLLCPLLCLIRNPHRHQVSAHFYHHLAPHHFTFSVFAMSPTSSPPSAHSPADLPPRTHLIIPLRAALTAPFAPPLYLHGPPTTAKLTTLRAAAGQHASLVVIDCILAHTDRLLYTALAQSSCSTAAALIAHLSKPRTDNHNSYTLLVFTRAERLAASTFSPAVLPLLFRLPELTRRSDLRVVLIARQPFPALRHAHTQPLPAPHSIAFAPFSEQEILSTIHFDRTRVPDLPDDLIPLAQRVYPDYAKSVVAVLHDNISDIITIRAVVDKLLPIYVTPIQPGKRFQSQSAFNRVCDQLTTTLHSLSPLPQQHISISIPTATTLPRTARILLVAAYLAGTVPRSKDVHYFTSERVRKRARRNDNVDDGDRRGVFPFERLLAIYRSVAPLSDRSPITPAPTAVLLHLSTLVALGFLSRADGASDPLAEPRFQAVVPADLANATAREVGIDITQYLSVRN